MLNRRCSTAGPADRRCRQKHLHFRLGLRLLQFAYHVVRHARSGTPGPDSPRRDRGACAARFRRVRICRKAVSMRSRRWRRSSAAARPASGRSWPCRRTRIGARRGGITAAVPVRPGRGSTRSAQHRQQMKGQAAMTSSPCSRQVAPAATILLAAGERKTGRTRAWPVGRSRPARLPRRARSPALRAAPCRPAPPRRRPCGSGRCSSAPRNGSADVIQRNHLDEAHGFALQTVMLANTDAARVALLARRRRHRRLRLVLRREPARRGHQAELRSVLQRPRRRDGARGFADPVAGRSRAAQAGRGRRPAGQVVAGRAGGRATRRAASISRASPTWSTARRRC